MKVVTPPKGWGGRTHTFGVKNPAEMLAKTIVYQSPGVRLSRGKPCLVESENQT
jgi:hypothetical protein